MQAIHAYTNLSPSAKESSNMWPLLTLDLNLSSLDHLADALAEAQEKVHGVEHIHLSKLTKDLLVAEPPITLGLINYLDSRLKGTALAGVRAGKREKGALVVS